MAYEVQKVDWSIKGHGFHIMRDTRPLVLLEYKDEATAKEARYLIERAIAEVVEITSHASY
jgi:hypothetical protein